MILPSSLVGAQRGVPRKDRAIASAAWARRSAEWRPWVRWSAVAHHQCVVALGLPHQRPSPSRCSSAFWLMVPETKDTTHRRGIDVPGALLDPSVWLLWSSA